MEPHSFDSPVETVVVSVNYIYIDLVSLLLRIEPETSLTAGTRSSHLVTEASYK